MFDWPDLIRMVLGSGVVCAAVYQTGQAVRERIRGQAEVAKIRAASEAKIAEMRIAHELERERSRDRRQLDRPSRRRVDLTQLHAERSPPDQLEPPAS